MRKGKTDRQPPGVMNCRVHLRGVPSRRHEKSPDVLGQHRQARERCSGPW
jgi:hypothetical protein